MWLPSGKIWWKRSSQRLTAVTELRGSSGSGLRIKFSLTFESALFFLLRGFFRHELHVYILNTLLMDGLVKSGLTSVVSKYQGSEVSRRIDMRNSKYTTTRLQGRQKKPYENLSQSLRKISPPILYVRISITPRARAHASTKYRPSSDGISISFFWQSVWYGTH